MIPYRDFTYPLNVFMHILTAEEGGVRALHYGLFERPDETIAEAQERSTELLLSRLPPPPARLLDVGSGLGTTLARLRRLGYDAEGITPDAQQAAMAGVPAAAFETWDGGPYDVLLFQESSQYIDSAALFAKARELAPRVVVLDEFATGESTLRPLDGFLSAAAANGFRVVERIDLSAKAAPTVDYFRARIPKYRDALIRDLGITDQQVDDLIYSGENYSAHYHSGAYLYLLLDLVR